jgi:hypothetical protein
MFEGWESSDWKKPGVVRRRLVSEHWWLNEACHVQCRLQIAIDDATLVKPGLVSPWPLVHPISESTHDDRDAVTRPED